MKTISKWKKAQEFESEQKGNRVQLDGDSQNGFSPKALLLSGLAACTGIDVVEILQKMKVPFTNLEIEAEAEQTDTHPKVFRDIQLTYTITTDKENEPKVKKAIDLSLDKYCGVAAMLKKNSAIGYTIQVR
jgi:putative redox protein